MPITKDQFLTEYSELKAAFDKLQPELEVTVRDPELGVEGYVVVWNTKPGLQGPLGLCGKGGTRITPQVTLEETRMLARTMALKNAAAGLAFGGAKSALRGDPDSPGFETQYRRFVSLCKPILRENGGVFGGFGFDIGAKPVHARWACDELGSTRSSTGKPLELGGTNYDVEGIAGLGVAVAGKTTLEVTGNNVKGATAAIQGLGAMGAAVCRYAAEFGMLVRYISDPRIGGTFELPEVVDPALQHAISTQNFDQITAALAQLDATKLPLDDVLYQAVDILFPCAVQNVITESNQSKILARFVVEGANSPLTQAARTALWNRSIIVIPDFIANPGGIIAAYVELTSQISPEENLRTRKNVDDAKKLTREKITENVRAILKLSNELQIEPVEAGLYQAYQNILRS